MAHTQNGRVFVETALSYFLTYLLWVPAALIDTSDGILERSRSVVRRIYFVFMLCLSLASVVTICAMVVSAVMVFIDRRWIAIVTVYLALYTVQSVIYLVSTLIFNRYNRVAH